MKNFEHNIIPIHRHATNVPRLTLNRTFVSMFLVLMATGLVCTEAAAAFDLEKAATAATDPLLKFTTTHWGKFVGLAGTASAVVGEGDLRTRAIRAAMGTGTAGAVILGVMAAIT